MSRKLEPSAAKKKFDQDEYPIVAIGASAGGMEAIVELLKNLPADTGMAYVYIQHLDPTHNSMLSTILAKATSMKVLEAKDKMPVQKDHLFIIPPNKDMSIIDGMLKLELRAAKPSPHMPIDKFFLSLAEKKGERAIGIVLSGNLDDGAIGLKAIKIGGGLTFAQNETAKFTSMPKAAVAEGGVDMVLPPAEIAHELARVAGQKLINKYIQQSPDGAEEIAVEELGSILELLRSATGADFSHYKKNTIRRRILRRMILHKMKDLDAYKELLQADPAEVTILYQDLLINVTSFFRDASVSDYMRKRVIPQLLKGKEANEPMRIWVPACSTGEEAYSLAMLLMEVQDEGIISFPVQIFGTDLSDMAVGKARLGMYTKDEVANISAARMQRFFVKVDNGYRIVKAIRDMCVFAPHNLLKDPPFSRLDIISCCNLFIYLDSELQRKVMATFHYSLRSNGYLILGKSETVGNSMNLFSSVDKKLKIYAKKKNAMARSLLDMTFPIINTEKRNMAATKGKTPPAGAPQTTNLQKTVDAVLLDSYVPPCVVVNEDMDILEFRGQLGIFLEPSPGRASLNLLKMAHGDLSFELRNAMHKAIKTGESQRKGGIHIKHNKKLHEVSIVVSPLRTGTDEKYFLVLFQECETGASPVSVVLTDNKRIQQLEKELAAAKDDMRTIIEEQDAVNEELQSANEEIVSSNEELQSINEEIETAKEELEASNEELLTINQELQVRNEQLTESYEYAESVFSTIREGVMVMDKDLRVKMANKAFCEDYKVKKEDAEGRLVFELGGAQWDIPRLHELLEELMKHKDKVHGFELQHSFPGIGEKILLLNVQKVTHRSQQLLLLAIEDVTAQTSEARLIAEREGWLKHLVNNIPVMMWVAGPDKMRNFFNEAWLQFTGRSMGQDVGMGWVKNLHQDDVDNFMKAYNNAFAKRRPYKVEYRLRRHDGEYLWVVSEGRPTFAPDDTFTGFIGICMEINEKVLAKDKLEALISERTQALQDANAALAQTNNSLQQFANVASHDMQEPLRKIVTFGTMLDEKYNENLPQEAVDYINKINANARRMSMLIHDLLSFSRLSKPEEDFRPVDLNALVKNVLADFDLLISQKDATVETGRLPVLTVSAVSIRQLFYNLISNALKFTRKDTAPHITISTRRATKADLAAIIPPEAGDKRSFQLIEVRDNGIGFDQKYAQKIFQIFQRLNNKDSYGGSGIGLAIVKRIVEIHQGHISVSSGPGKGTAFSILLPLAK